MSVPTDPNKIVFKNEIYPNGLKAIDIYNYYIDKKDLIIKNTDNRNVLLFMNYDDNKNKDLVVKRKLNNKPIVLNNDNYEDIISGYNISISVETEYPNHKTKEKIIDIDPRNVTDLSKIKQVLFELETLYKDKKYIITNGRTGFHFRIQLDKAMDRSKAKLELQLELNRVFGQKYSINSKLNRDLINLDLSPMDFKGSLTVIGALTRNGLMCKDITKIYKSYKFDQSKLRIK